MTIRPEWTVNSVKAEIALAEQDLFAERRALDALTDRRDIVTAHGRVRDLVDTINLLQQRLKAVQERDEANDRVQEEKRVQAQTQMDEAKERHDALTAELEALVLPLAQAISAAMPEIDRIAQERSDANARHAEAFAQLSPNEVAPSLSFNRGTSLSTEDRPELFEVLMFALYVALNTRLGMDQGLDDAVQGLAIRAQQDAAHRRLVFGPREVEPARPGATSAEQDETVRREFYSRLRNNGAQIL